MKKCKSCSSSNATKNRFCDNCGANLETKQHFEEMPQSEEPKLVSILNEFNLRTWKPWRWLFETTYGKLWIEKDQLMFALKPRLSLKIFRILSRLFYWGFDPLSFLSQQGSNSLKNLTTISILEPKWITWKFHILIIRSSGFIAIYPVPAEDLRLLQAFRMKVIDASREAVYNTRTK